MFRRPPSSAGFAVAPQEERALDRGILPALIATLSLCVSIAIVLSTVTARAAQLF
ncbi:MAG TPA: hypothetical protein VK438_14025 [Xanthobacteraceae bacterium]|nr:hypothetical protein [Xanthobacteraceae bacterium]